MEAVLLIMRDIQKEDPYKDVYLRDILERLKDFTVRGESQKQRLKDLGWEPVVKDGKTIMRNNMTRRTVYNCLEVLTAQRTEGADEFAGTVIQLVKGKYSTDEALRRRRNMEAAYRKLLSFGEGDLKGESKSTFLGKTFARIPVDPLGYLKGTHSYYDQVKKTRLAVHGNKKIAEEEALISRNSFFGNVTCEIGSTGSSPKLLSGKLFTSIRQELPMVLVGTLFSKQLEEVKAGIDALIFKESAEIMRNLVFELIDLESWDFSDPDVEIVVKIRFNPKKYVDRFLRGIFLSRSWMGPEVFPEISIPQEYEMLWDEEQAERKAKADAVARAIKSNRERLKRR